MGLKFTMADDAHNLHTHRLWDLCEFLAVRVMEPFLKRQGVKLDPRFTSYFSPGTGSTPHEATGVIEFYPPGMFATRVTEFEEAIRRELGKFKIRVGPFEHEEYAERPFVRVVRIPVLVNPTAESGPPEVHMSVSAGRVVLRDLLGFTIAQGVYALPVDELLGRINAVTEERIVACSSAPMRIARSGKGPRRTSSAITAQRIQRCLTELAALARWALGRKIAAIQAA